MNTIALRVEAAMRATEHQYNLYKILTTKRKTYKAALFWRTLAVVKHDRYLNGRR